MEHHFGFFEAKHQHVNQLVRAKDYLGNKDYVSALNTYTNLLELLKKDYIYDDLRYQYKIKNVLLLCHEFRLYGCFEFFFIDLDIFLKYKQVYVEHLQCD